MRFYYFCTLVQQAVTSNFRQPTMRTLTAVFLLITFFSCSDRQGNDISKDTNLLITAIDVKFPLRLDEINLEDNDNAVNLDNGIIFKIEETIKEYAKDIEFYDSLQTYRDTYINTIQLHDSLQTIYLILLKHYPTGKINSKVLFYNNQKEEFVDKKFDFNLHALYDYDNGTLTPTNLKTDFEIISPEIELMDFNKDGVSDYKFVRLWHNGTSNTLQTTILTIKNNELDTLSFKEKQMKSTCIQREKK